MNPGDLKEWIESVGGKARIARILQVDESTLWRYENGKEKIPGYMAAFVRMSDKTTRQQQLIKDIEDYSGSCLESETFHIYAMIQEYKEKTNDKPIPGRD